MAKILVIDDEEGVRQYFDSLLSRMGYEVETAEDGESGLAKAGQEGIDLIIADFQLPGDLQRTELIKALRAQCPDTPLVVISGHADANTVNECEAMGVSDVLTKPFEIPFVSSVVKRLIGEPDRAS